MRRRIARCKGNSTGSLRARTNARKKFVAALRLRTEMSLAAVTLAALTMNDHENAGDEA
jgi:hypothetical protein